MPEPDKNEAWEYYQSQHQSLGCKLTHLFGVPLITISFPVLFLDWKLALLLFSAGWLMQFAGHYLFEKNTPIVLTERRSLATLYAALHFALRGWLDIFCGLMKRPEFKKKVN